MTCLAFCIHSINMTDTRPSCWPYMVGPPSVSFRLRQQHVPVWTILGGWFVVISPSTCLCKVHGKGPQACPMTHALHCLFFPTPFSCLPPVSRCHLPSSFFVCLFVCLPALPFPHISPTIPHAFPLKSNRRLLAAWATFALPQGGMQTEIQNRHSHLTSGEHRYEWGLYI